MTRVNVSRDGWLQRLLQFRRANAERPNRCSNADHREAVHKVTEVDLDGFIETLRVLTFDLSELVTRLCHLPARQPLAAIEKPPLPDKLESAACI